MEAFCTTDGKLMDKSEAVFCNITSTTNLKSPVSLPTMSNEVAEVTQINRIIQLFNTLLSFSLVHILSNFIFFKVTALISMQGPTIILLEVIKPVMTAMQNVLIICLGSYSGCCWPCTLLTPIYYTLHIKHIMHHFLNVRRLFSWIDWVPYMYVHIM